MRCTCESVASTARRTSSWRNRTCRPSIIRIPCRSASTSAAEVCGSSSRVTASSTRPGATASRSTAARVGGASRCTRASTASRTASGSAAVGGGEHLGDEERVAARDAVHPGRVEVRRRPRHQRRHGGGDRRVRRSRCTPGPTNAPSVRRRGCVRLVVAVGQHEQARQARDAAREHPQDVQGRVVGPVHVFDDQDGRPARVGQLVEDEGEHGPGPSTWPARGRRRRPGRGRRRGTGPASGRSPGRRMRPRAPGTGPPARRRPGQGSSCRSPPRPRRARPRRGPPRRPPARRSAPPARAPARPGPPARA